MDLADATDKGVLVLVPEQWGDDGDAYTIAGVSRPVPTVAPTVTALVPATFAHDDPPQEVLVQGTDFMRGDRVIFGGSTPVTGFHSDTELAVDVNPANWQPGELDVRVGYTTRGPSNALPFTVT